MNLSDMHAEAEAAWFDDIGYEDHEQLADDLG